MSAAYYNENEPKAAAWLRELIKAGLIADGEVDERSIDDVVPTELAGFTQCHFFAGIGVWSYALRQAGWPDDRPVWTGSCPCQPFSAAGKRAGFADERHLWPAWFHLISQCQPDAVFGEQVAGKDGFAWLDVVHDDLETAGYAVGALSLPACGFGAPHKRERLFFVADSCKTEWRGRAAPDAGRTGMEYPANNGKASDLAESLRAGWAEGWAKSRNGQATGGGGSCDMGNPESNGWTGRQDDGNGRGRECSSGQASEDGGMGDSSGTGLEIGFLPDGRRGVVRIKGQAIAETGVVRGFWQGADAILCADEDGWKWRLVKSCTFPLAHGVAARMAKLRGIGNAIVAPVAEAFIRAYLENEQANL